MSKVGTFPGPRTRYGVHLVTRFSNYNGVSVVSNPYSDSTRDTYEVTAIMWFGDGPADYLVTGHVWQNRSVGEVMALAHEVCKRGHEELLMLE